MDFSEGHYPTTLPYIDYNGMRPVIWKRMVAILDFGIKMGLQFTKWNPNKYSTDNWL